MLQFGVCGGAERLLFQSQRLFFAPDPLLRSRPQSENNINSQQAFKTIN
jgi:hypothetical protein